MTVNVLIVKSDASYVAFQSNGMAAARARVLEIASDRWYKSSDSEITDDSPVFFSTAGVAGLGQYTVGSLKLSAE